MNGLKKFLNGYTAGIHTVKLRDILALHSTDLTQTRIQTMFPPIGVGSITLVDQIVLLSLCKAINAKNILEVGTFLGYTTTLLAMNTNARVYSIDLPAEECDEIEYDEEKIYSDDKFNDNFLRYKQAVDGAKYLELLDKSQKARVKLIKQDSTKLDFSVKFGNLDFIFIDGGHSREIIHSDTTNALKAVDKGIIVWHDFSSQIHTDVTDYLSGRQDLKIFHVSNSLCAFSFVGFDT
jgi:predicted O-methyltransferase YrrM